jgi:AraC-like DNA-binding protein
MEVALFFWAFIQSFLLGVTVIIYRNTPPNRILATFFFMVSAVILFQYLLKYEQWLFLHPVVLFIPDLINIALGPVLYLYSFQLIFKKWANVNFLHFLPLLFLAAYFYFFEIQPEETFDYSHYIDTAGHVFVLTLILLSNITYLVLFFRNYQKCRPEQKHETDKIKRWFQILLVFFVLQIFINLFIWCLHFYLMLNAGGDMINARAVKDVIFIILNAVILSTSGFFIVANPEVITSLGVKISNRLKSKAYVIDKNEALLNIAKLEKLMVEEKIYLDPQLNEKLLADKLNLQTYYLSKLMNEHIKCNFNEFINKARIEETKRLLKSEKTRDLTLFAIAIDSGFSSESVFYSNFKKYVGMTPNQYKKQILKKN